MPSLVTGRSYKGLKPSPHYFYYPNHVLFAFMFYVCLTLSKVIRAEPFTNSPIHLTSFGLQHGYPLCLPIPLATQDYASCSEELATTDACEYST